MKFEALTTLIKTRRSVFPKQYVETALEIDDDLIAKILENANWAPNHKKTEPWRFKVFKGKGLQTLSEYLGKRYKEMNQGEKFSEFKYKKTINKPLKCGAIIGICMQRDPQSSLPEWEEIAAVACAVQNMWLSCTALGIGSYWSTPSTITGKNDLMNLSDGETCLGLFYMGYYGGEALPADKGEIQAKMEWFRD